MRADIAQIVAPDARLKTRTGALRLLVVGGSLGAQALNDVMPKALAKINANNRPKIVHQAGEKHIATLKENYEKADVRREKSIY